MTMTASLVLLCLLLGPGVPSRAGDPLTSFNDAFRETYAKAKADSLVRTGPVLMLAGDQLLLYRHAAKVAETTVRPTLYHRLKAVAHTPLAIHLLFTAPDRPSRERVADLRRLAEAARADLARWAPPALLANQERILDGCLGLLDRQLRPGGADPESLAAFALAMGPLVLANADQAAALELEALDRGVARFREGLAPGEWEALRVVVIGSHMAREGEVAMQYFCRLLAEPGEGNRVVFAEGLWQARDAMDLLATHRVDLGLGAAFFRDPMRMHRDILADGAGKWLDGHLPPGPAH
ncbi:MAG: hypothetical protein P4L36_06175 [Holophaga sp.]|nr:hypothetical protein [Holophaga sp.]